MTDSYDAGRRDGLLRAAEIAEKECRERDNLTGRIACHVAKLVRKEAQAEAASDVPAPNSHRARKFLLAEYERDNLIPDTEGRQFARSLRAITTALASTAALCDRIEELEEMVDALNDKLNERCDLLDAAEARIKDAVRGLEGALSSSSRGASVVHIRNALAAMKGAE